MNGTTNSGVNVAAKNGVALATFLLKSVPDLALQQLNAAVQWPSGSVGYGLTSYGGPKLMPFWDPLRGDPRFEKIVASLAPKQ